MFPLRAKDHVTTPTPSLRNPLLSCTPQLSKKLPEPTDYCYHPLLPLPEVKVKSLLLKKHCVRQTQDPEAHKPELTSKPHVRANLHGTKSSLFLQKTWSQVLAPTWQFINSRESNVFRCPLWAMHMCAYRHVYTYICTHIIKQNSKCEVIIENTKKKYNKQGLTCYL